MSCDYNQLLLEGYKEQTVSWKHEDNTLYKFGAVLLPVSFVALGVPYIGDVKESNLTILEIISTIGGIILMTFWVAYAHATHAKVTTRFRIINQIEERWGIIGHKDIRLKRDEIFKPPRLLPLKTYVLETSIFYVYLSMALILTAYRCYDKWTICKSLAIGSSLPVLAVIIGSMAIACIYDCSIRKGEKTLLYRSLIGRGI